MKLFNVDHEHWEEVDRGYTAPPDGALAFDVEGADWIFTKRSLDGLRSSTTLRYTQHGLDLMREDGHEGRACDGGTEGAVAGSMNEKIINAPDISGSIDGVLENLKLDLPLRQAPLRANLLLTNLMTLLRPIRIKNRAPGGPKVMYTAEQLGLTLARVRTLKALVLRGIKEIESGQQWAAKETFTRARDSWNAGQQKPAEAQEG